MVKASDGPIGRVVKASDLGEVLMFSRGIKSDRKFCPPKKTTWYVDGRVHSRLRFYVAAALADFTLKGQYGRVVKVSGLGEVLMFSRGIKSDHKSCPPKKTTWYVDGRVNSRLRFYVAAELVDIFNGQDGRVAKASDSVRYSVSVADQI